MLDHKDKAIMVAYANVLASPSTELRIADGFAQLVNTVTTSTWDVVTGERVSTKATQ